MVNLTEKKILITGGCGFIGSNFIEFLFDKYDDISITNIDKMGVGSRNLVSSNIKKYRNSQYVQIPEDLRNIEKIHFNNSVKFDYIFHFAAESHVDRSISSPLQFIENNVIGIGSILEWVRRTQPQARFINISTDEVYGHLLCDFERPFRESDKFAPRSPYSASKASADLIANSYVETYGLDIITTHCCNNFGPHQADEKFIPTIIRNIFQGNKIPLYGNGKNIREWIYVDDHNKSLLEIAKVGESGTRYNIGSGVEKTNLQMIIDIGEMCGITPDIEYVDDRKGHDFRYAIESLKYFRGFELSNHNDVLSRTVEFYKNKYKK